MKQTVIVSTVGTSLLTNGSGNLRDMLLRTANDSDVGLDAEDRKAIHQRVEAVKVELLQADSAKARRMSAELNGILAIDKPRCHHYLLCTDTHQGKITAELVRDWLAQQRISAEIVVLEGLSTMNSAAFAHGTDALLRWCEEKLGPETASAFTIIFNLVGGFKSLQAFAQTLGMFYADRICYIFEGSGELINIPRLPIKIDLAALKPHAAALARLACAVSILSEEASGIPEVMVAPADGGGVGLSLWGSLIYLRSREELLGDGSLLDQPGLAIEDSFRADFKKEKQAERRAAIQESLAKASILWRRGGLAALRSDAGLLYENWRNGGGSGHFRVDLAYRISCVPDGTSLRLTHCGAHDYVERVGR